MTPITPTRLVTHAYDTGGARAIQDELFALYAEIYADQLSDPFYSVERFADRFVGHSGRSGFLLVTGRIDDELIGYAYGGPLGAATQWWNGLREEVPPDVVAEDGSRTFALNEIMVKEGWRRRGIARSLHDTLLADRPERRATLLVDPANTAAKAAYLSWGWQLLGHLQPFSDAPIYDALVVDLPLSHRAAG
ncbi:GNAT family N-acetyltransferase [Cryptosporangium aurantiacum]|uniref:Acetyltransferase (GNAT) family protein n=1 Tax=Cryptosporangium aurantiacum TaxID=134849 RepID=A0A1M7NNL9_9ACTN|nr:GNAT family N-acetyltransferase [Cryptosporangium aurantiacum]SHN05589.1 Acetyltransferase (GNAT) family protein [Cryptosporangium aurantiacum]